MSTHLTDDRTHKGDSTSYDRRELLADAKVCASHSDNYDWWTVTIDPCSQCRKFFRSRIMGSHCARLDRERDRTNAQFTWGILTTGINHDDEICCCHPLCQFWCQLVHG